MKVFSKLLAIALLLNASVTYAIPTNQFYGAIDAGIFQASYNSKYLDQTDLIPQNISETFLQNGYTAGIALGWTHVITPRYFIGAELAGNLDGNSAFYQSGSSSSAFSDRIQINRHLDLTVMPGIITNSAFFPYLKLGVSAASVTDTLNSPAGFNPVMTQYNTNKTIYGFMTGLGVRYVVNARSWLFLEADYRDYGTINFSSFQNFSANYSHSAHIYSYGALIGASYAFNV